MMVESEDAKPGMWKANYIKLYVNFFFFFFGCGRSSLLCVDFSLVSTRWGAAVWLGCLGFSLWWLLFSCAAQALGRSSCGTWASGNVRSTRTRIEPCPVRWQMDVFFKFYC